MIKTIFPLLLLIVLLSCNSKPDGVNFLVQNDKKDTVSHFYYRGHEKYQFIDEVGLDTALENAESRKIVGGKFVFGIKDRVNSVNRFLIFKKKPEDVFKTDKVHLDFLADEYRIVNPYRVVVFQNYIDSLDNPIRKYETYVAVDSQSGDTILFQEVNFVINKLDMVTTLIAYDNLKRREEMRLLLDDAVKTIKSSIYETQK